MQWKLIGIKERLIYFLKTNVEESRQIAHKILLGTTRFMPALPKDYHISLDAWNPREKVSAEIALRYRQRNGDSDAKGRTAAMKKAS